MPVILIISLVFLFYILSIAELGEVEVKITDKGLNIGNSTTSWEIITRFWFVERFEKSFLIFETTTLPGRLEVIINSKDKNTIRQILKKYIPEEKTSPTGLERASDWISQRLYGE